MVKHVNSRPNSIRAFYEEPQAYSYLLNPQVVNNLSVWSWLMFSDRVGYPIALAYCFGNVTSFMGFYPLKHEVNIIKNLKYGDHKAHKGSYTYSLE
jgi:hypothetical protein